MQDVLLPGGVSALSTTDGTAGDQAHRNSIFAVALAVLALVIYACTVFTLPQVRNSLACCKSSGIAAGISNIMYGTPLGSLYSGTFSYFDDRIYQPLSQTLEQARKPGVGLPAIPSGTLYTTTRDGNGIGYPLVATAAFRLFGIHAWALQLTMLLLMALSAAAFLWRFPSAAFAGVVTLYFTALTGMLFTSVVWEPRWQIQIAVGGVRFFSLVSVLPLFHILLTLVDPHPPQRKTAIGTGAAGAAGSDFAFDRAGSRQHAAPGRRHRARRFGAGLAISPQAGAVAGAPWQTGRDRARQLCLLERDRDCGAAGLPD